jgi:hypothetical protein
MQSLAEEFQQRHCLRFRQLLEPGLLAAIHRRMDEAEFYERLHPRIGTEECMKDGSIVGFLHFLANDPTLFRFIQSVTGCGRIGCFAGRVYRMVPGRGHYDSWHSDVGEFRMVGMSMNLSKEIYAGGVFQLRDQASGRILCEAANTGPGDGIIFRIAPGFQHRITAVQGGVPKTAFAGWFQSQPEYAIAKGRIL